MVKHDSRINLIFQLLDTKKCTTSFAVSPFLGALVLAGRVCCQHIGALGGGVDVGVDVGVDAGVDAGVGVGVAGIQPLHHLPSECSANSPQSKYKRNGKMFKHFHPYFIFEPILDRTDVCHSLQTFPARFPACLENMTASNPSGER